MIQPTIKNRIATLDVIRGVAILGILIANITAFGWPEMAAWTTGRPFHIGPHDELVNAFRHWLVSGKMRSLLSMLFGVGMYLQWSKRQAQGLPWPGTYIKRMLILAAIGAFHGIFIWYGDILFLYAALGLLSFWLVNVSDKVLILLAAGAISFSTLLGVGLDAITMQGLGREVGAGFFGNEAQVYASANYLDQLGFRAGMWVSMLAQIPFVGLHLGGMFALGVVLGRTGILANPSRHKMPIKILLLLGAAGLAVNALPVLLKMSGSRYSINNMIEMGLAAPMALGYAAVIAVAVERGWLRAVTTILGRVGQVALSVYLLTSLICTTLFYGWGLGWFGKLAMPQLMAVVVVVWVVVTTFAILWTQKFQFGPVEWLWRSLTLGRKLPIKIRPGDTLVQPPPRLPSVPSPAAPWSAWQGEDGDLDRFSPPNPDLRN